MTISDYLQKEVFSRRAQDHNGCLVVYDPDRRYRETVLTLQAADGQVIDASTSVIEQREAATVALSQLAAGSLHQLILWIPAERPEDDDAKQRDPFSVFAEIGDVFPKGDGDEFPELCRKAKPDHVSEINRMFEEGDVTFEMIDALEAGGAWPKLKTLLDAKSPKEILIGILAPKPDQDKKLKEDGTWAAEAREFVQRTLGHRLKTKGQTRGSIADELWRLILFSEFVFDSAGDVPDSLQTVPRAGDEARSLVFDVCEDLRRHDDHKDLYKGQAQEIEEELMLPVRTEAMKYLGVRDTFSFEERIYLQRLVERALGGEIDAAREIWDSRQRSIWLSQEDRLAEWTLAARSLDVLDAAIRFSTPKFSSLEAIVHGYASTWRELDRRHRELEQAVNQVDGEHETLDALIDAARTAYFISVEALQVEFIRFVSQEGWPATGANLLWNRQLFSKVVAPLLDQGKRVAYFLVDSLRYELGVEVEKQLSDKLKVTLQTVCAQLPTYTEVGMASLMPDAETALSMTFKNDKLVTTLGGKLATAPATRFSYLQSRKGDQCGDIALDELVRKKKPKLEEKTRLLIVRSRDIDSIAHDSPHQVLDLIPTLVRQIIRGVSKVASLGFDVAVIATDHGFLLFHEQEAGNVAARPGGNWAVKKSRCMLGDGDSDSANLVMAAEELGIPGDIKSYAAPRTLVPYARDQLYYHEGLSLQECVLPCLTIELASAESPNKKQQAIRLTLSYRQGKIDKITSRRPVVDLSWPEGDLFAEESEREVAIEAVNSKGEIVGYAGSGQSVNPATGGVRIKPGAAISIGLRMEDEFSGSFNVRVLDPVTSALLADLPLKTAYLA